MNPKLNEIVLRPRFQIEVNHTKENVLGNFEVSGTPPFLVKRLDEHVFIKFNNENNSFWSPQLHLEIDEIDHLSCRIYGVFGPNPTLWTFFMFIHFILASLFIILGIWAYSNAALNKAFSLQLTLMALIILFWFALYFFGRSGKKRSKPQMQLLYNFMTQVLDVQKT